MDLFVKVKIKLNHSEMFYFQFHWFYSKSPVTGGRYDIIEKLLVAVDYNLLRSLGSSEMQKLEKTEA